MTEALKAPKRIYQRTDARREYEQKLRAARTPEARARRNQLQRAWYIKNRAKAMLISSRARAKSKGWEHNLTIEDIVVPDVCPVLGIAMDSASLDRIENHLGYLKGNVRVISTRANELKSNATIDELQAVVAYMERERLHRTAPSSSS